MYGFGLISLLVVLLIGGFVFIKPDISMLQRATDTSEASPIGSAREVCRTSAGAAYAMDLQIAGVQCPKGSEGVPDSMCAGATSDGAKAYAKFVSAEKSCAN